MTDHAFAQSLIDSPFQSVADYYARHLNDAAHRFLVKNCLSADAALGVGFADRTLGKTLPIKASNLGAAVRIKLKMFGILKASGHEALRGFVTAPLTDGDETITGIYGLRLDNKGKDQPQLTLGRGIFNASALQRFDEIILCESLVDAWSFHAAGHINAIAIEGEQLTEDDLRGIRRILLCGDVAIDPQLIAGRELLRIHLPVGLTANAYAVLNKSVEGALAARIRAAVAVERTSGFQPETLCHSGPTTESTEAGEKATESIEPPATQTVTPESPKQSPAASPIPVPLSDIDVVHSGEDINLTVESRRYRVRGLSRNNVPGVMRVNLLALNLRNDRLHVDSLDLYHARARRLFAAEAAAETAVAESQLRADLGRLLLKLEELQHQAADISRNALASGPQAPSTMTDSEQAAALELLQDERLLDRVLADFQSVGVVGEQNALLAAYLAATSRLLDKPLGLVIQSSSAAGKSTLADAVLNFLPPEAKLQCSALTSQSLYYLASEDLRHKVLAIAEEEGARHAAYQLKLLQSDGKLSLVSTTKERGSGRTAAERYEVTGPVTLMLTTTALDVDPELMNRCLVVCVDESGDQTAAIQQRQRFADTLEGYHQQLAADGIQRLHQNTQRLLRPLKVFNPYADQLRFVGNQTRHRRDHAKYLTLIKAITLLHQHQREVHSVEPEGRSVEYLTVTRRDIALANVIADWALGRSIDELAAPTRRLLLQLFDWLRRQAKEQQLPLGEVTFTRRAAREALGWTATQFHFHLDRLCRDEYAVRCSGGNGQLSTYRLLFDGRGREGQRSLIGLVDATKLLEPASTITTTTNLSAS